MIAAIAYFTMASNLGWTGIAVEFQRSDPKVAGTIRQIFYVRHIDCKFLFLSLYILCSQVLIISRVPHNATGAPRPSADRWAPVANYFVYYLDRRGHGCHWSDWRLGQKLL
jgi:hypothetical protein